MGQQFEGETVEKSYPQVVNNADRDSKSLNMLDKRAWKTL